MGFASSSSCSSFLRSEPYFIYDVFINFWGQDIGRKFVSHLHAVLLQAQVKTLFNEEKFHEGMKVEEHKRAIACSKIAIIVFSETYTESTNCLLELEKIIECRQTFGQIVLPVFYEIDPLDVRHQKDDFGRTLAETAHKSYSGEQMEHALSRWSRALTTAASIIGWDARDFRHDAELVDVIVNRVQTLLDYQDFVITQFPIGLESHAEKVIRCIENHSTKVCMLGIWGMGGSGKTTFAKAIYNRIYRPFIGKSYIENIEKVRNPVYGTHVHLQEKLLYNVLKTDLEVESVAMGRTIIETELSRRKLLIVLEDVNEFGQLANLCGNLKWFGKGTVIIITTTDVRVLNRLKVNYIYKMNVMNENESLELFSWHAFEAAKPRKELNEHARNIVAYCGRLPLALKLFGSFLCGTTMEEWEILLPKLTLIPIPQVEEKLKISFDGLRDSEKDIFLVICCFFIGKERGCVTEILNGCGLPADIGITVLIECCLIKVGRNNKIDMHPLVQRMGGEIIRERWPLEPENRSQLWFQDDVEDVVKMYIARTFFGTKATRGLSLRLHSNKINCLEAHTFKKMKRLRLLQLDHVQLNADYRHLFKDLRWICWQRFPFIYIPNNFYMKNIIAIDFKHSHLQLVWKPPLWKQPQVLGRLKFLNLSHSKYLRETPDFSRLPILERLILKDCPSLCMVHPSIGDLCNILLINLKDCTNLSSLPKEVYKLKSLRTFILSGCFKIHIFEEDIVQMESLIILVTENTVVKQVPYSVISSKSIGYISLRGFEGLPHNIFPSIIRSWMSPIMNPQSYISTFSMDMENNNWRDLVPLHSGLANVRSVLVQCDTAFQLSQQVKIILAEYDLNIIESRISKHQLRFSLIGVGCYNEFLNTLSDSVSERLACSESWDVSLPNDNYPYWLAHMGEGHSASFTMPHNCDTKGMILCVVYLSSPGIVATECLTSVLIVNYTKCTFQIHKRDTVFSFNEEDWHGIISNLGSRDKVEIFVTFGHKLVVKNTVAYLLSGMEMESAKGPYLKENY